MKKMIIGAAALGLLLGQAASAQPAAAELSLAAEQGGYDRGDHEWRDHDRWDRRNEDRWQQGRNDRRRQGWGQERGQGHRWSRGQQMGYNDWNRAERVDYRRYHLRTPPRGYEWRRQNNQFVLAAVATGLIASIIFNSGR